MDISMELIPKINAGVKVRDEKFGLLLVSKRTPILALNQDSEIIWKCFDGSASIGEIAVKVNEQIEGNPEETVEVVKCFVESCYDLGLIEF